MTGSWPLENNAVNLAYCQRSGVREKKEANLEKEARAKSPVINTLRTSIDFFVLNSLTILISCTSLSKISQINLNSIEN